MSNLSQLKSFSKSLKLSGMKDTLDMRIREAEENQLSYSELVALLLQDEIQTRNNRKLKRLLSKANLHNNKTIENFDFSANPSLNAAAIRELATGNFIGKGENIFFVGPTGVGKTHLASAIGHQACRSYLKVLFYKFSSLIENLLNADLVNKLESFLKYIINVDLLIIDDFAFKGIDQKSAELLYTIVDEKYLRKSIIITSNRDIADWSNIFPDPIMANAVLDRLAHNAHQITIKGQSYRKKNKPILQNA